MDPAFGVLSIDVCREVNRIPDARVVLVDGNVSTGGFPISDTEFFEPGREIEIKLRHDDADDVTVFKGLVVRHGIQAGRSGSMLVVEIRDPCIKLAHGRRSAVFRELSDAEIFQEIVANAGLEAGEFEATQPTHAEIVQYNATDWDFMLSRADALGLVTVVQDGAVSVRAIDLSAAPSEVFELGVGEFFELEMEADVESQPPEVEGVAFDPAALESTGPSAGAAFSLEQGDLDPAALAGDLGFETVVLSHPVPLDPDELQGWADGHVKRARMAMIRGRLSVPGRAGLVPLALIELSGVGARFSGKALVSGVRHRVDEEGWRTDVQVGLSSERFAARADIRDYPAAGLLPGVSGLQVGVGEPFEEDPEDLLRLKVLLPAVGADAGAVWARLLTPDGGAERGFFFRPEPGDEVVVGFLNGDPRQPVVLGALFGAANRPPTDFAELTEGNEHKGIVTSSGTAIHFTDGDTPSLVIETPGSNRIALDDEGETVQITDQHGNEITLSSAGIEIKSSADFKIEASGNVEIGGAAVDVK